MTQRVLLVDGMALLFRHFYATSLHKQFMYNSKGIPTNGIQGFVRHILRQLRILNQVMSRYVGIWGKRPLEMICILLINKIDLHHQMN